jgi:hypothetical protein
MRQCWCTDAPCAIRKKLQKIICKCKAYQIRYASPVVAGGIRAPLYISDEVSIFNFTSHCFFLLQLPSVISVSHHLHIHTSPFPHICLLSVFLPNLRKRAPNSSAHCLFLQNSPINMYCGRETEI